MSEDTDNVTAEAASAETQTMAEWLHAYYLKALFAEGINGWEHSMVHGHGRYLRTIPALEGKIFSETDAKRLGIWLKDVFPSVIASIGVDVRSNQLVIAMPGKTMDTWARDGLIGASDAGQLIALEHPAPITNNDAKTILEYQLKAQLLSREGWSIAGAKGNTPSYAVRTIIVPKALADSLVHHETGECGTPTQVAQLALQIFHAAQPHIHVRFFPQRARDGSILLDTQIHAVNLGLIAPEGDAPSNVASLAARRAVKTHGRGA